MALKDTGGDLADAITAVLTAAQGPEKCSISIDEVDEDGNMSTKTYALGGGEGTIDFSTLMSPLLYSTGVSDSGVTGVEALASVIADKVIVHIMENFELAAAPRYDQLETDFNMLVQLLGTTLIPLSATPMSGPGVAAAVMAAAMSVGGPARAGITGALKGAEMAQTMGGELL